MRQTACGSDGGRMTTISTPALTITPPLSRAARIGTGLCLLAAGVSNGLGQYVGELAMPDLDDFSAQILWGADHPGSKLPNRPRCCSACWSCR